MGLRADQALNDELARLEEHGRYAEASRLAREALTARERALGPDHPRGAATLNRLAGLHETLGNYGEARVLLARWP